MPAAFPPPFTYLVVSAHPDDADFGAAGTAAQLVRRGHAVHYLLLTSGDEGGEDPYQETAELVAIREAEQREACRILGLTGVHFLRFSDGTLEPTVELRRCIVRVIRQIKADVILCQDPRRLVNEEGTYLNHPDHRAAGQAALDAAFPAAGNPRSFRDLLAEGLAAHKVREVWLYFVGAEQANHWVDISNTLELKVQALAAHVSQIGDWAASGQLRETVTRWARDEARGRGEGMGAAEAFQRIVLEGEQRRDAPVTAEVEAAVS